MRRAFDLSLAVASGVMLTFLLLPILALFLRVPPGELISQLGSKAAIDAIVISLKTNFISLAFVLAFGTPAAYLLGTKRFRGRSVVLSAIELPLVLPPAVAGIALLAAFGRRGLLGETFEAGGVTISFTQVAVVIAIIFVSSPFYLRQAIEAFAAVDQTYVDASKSLGASPFRTFRRISIPLAASGLSSGAALAWARGMGEFGATLIFAGSFAGATQTLPLAIYDQLDQDFGTAIAIGALLVLISLAVLLSVRFLSSWARYRSTSPINSARSVSG